MDMSAQFVPSSMLPNDMEKKMILKRESTWGREKGGCVSMAKQGELVVVMECKIYERSRDVKQRERH
jgi:hypothetical protein